MKPLIIIIVLAILLLLGLSVLPVYRARRDKRLARRRIIYQLCGFFAMLALFVFTPLGGMLARAAGAEAVEATAEKAGDLAAGLGYISAALSTGLSCLGAGIAVGSSAPAAIGAFSEDPKSFGKAMVFVVMGEGVALFGFLVSVMILGKI